MNRDGFPGSPYIRHCSLVAEAVGITVVLPQLEEVMCEFAAVLECWNISSRWVMQMGSQHHGLVQHMALRQRCELGFQHSGGTGLERDKGGFRHVAHIPAWPTSHLGNRSMHSCAAQ